MAFSTYVIIPGDANGNPQPKMTNAFTMIGVPINPYGSALPPTPVAPVIDLVTVVPGILVTA